MMSQSFMRLFVSLFPYRLGLVRCIGRFRAFPVATLAMASSAALMPTLALGLEVRGEWTQGAMLVGSVEPGSKVIFQGRSLRLSPEGDFVFGLGRDAPAQVSLEVVTGDYSESRVFAVSQRTYNEQRIEGVPQETVTPPREVLERIRTEARQVGRARAGLRPQADYLSGFVMPLEGTITGVYGSRRVYNGIPKRPHYGIDIARPSGTLVHAPAPGVIKLVHDDMYYSGGTLVIDHGYGVSSTMIHLSEILVTEGKRVGRGDAVGRVGASGRATGPHLDWRVNWFKVRLDPQLVLKYFPAHKMPE